MKWTTRIRLGIAFCALLLSSSANACPSIPDGYTDKNSTYLFVDGPVTQARGSKVCAEDCSTLGACTTGAGTYCTRECRTRFMGCNFDCALEHGVHRPYHHYLSCVDRCLDVEGRNYHAHLQNIFRPCSVDEDCLLEPELPVYQPTWSPIVHTPMPTSAGFTPAPSRAPTAEPTAAPLGKSAEIEDAQVCHLGACCTVGSFGCRCLATSRCATQYNGVVPWCDTQTNTCDAPILCTSDAECESFNAKCGQRDRDFEAENSYNHNECSHGFVTHPLYEIFAAGCGSCVANTVQGIVGASCYENGTCALGSVCIAATNTCAAFKSYLVLPPTCDASGAAECDSSLVTMAVYDAHTALTDGFIGNGSDERTWTLPDEENIDEMRALVLFNTQHTSLLRTPIAAHLSFSIADAPVYCAALTLSFLVAPHRRFFAPVGVAIDVHFVRPVDGLRQRSTQVLVPADSTVHTGALSSGTVYSVRVPLGSQGDAHRIDAFVYYVDTPQRRARLALTEVTIECSDVPTGEEELSTSLSRNMTLPRPCLRNSHCQEVFVGCTSVIGSADSECVGDAQLPALGFCADTYCLPCWLDSESEQCFASACEEISSSNACVRNVACGASCGDGEECRLGGCGSVGNITEVCPPGYAWQFSDALGGDECRLCGAGSYSDTEDAVSCIGCADGLFQSASGATECLACPVDGGSVGATLGSTADRTACRCSDERTFSPARRECVCAPGRFGSACQVCPSGAECSPDGEEPVALPGYFVLNITGDDGSLQIVVTQCTPPSACLGANVCAPAYTGTLCSQCAADYYRPSRAECSECPSGGSALSVTALLLIFLSLAFIFVFAAYRYRVALEVSGSGGAASVHAMILQITLGHMQTIGVIFLFGLRWPPIAGALLSVLRQVFTWGPHVLATDCVAPDSIFNTYAFKLSLRLLSPILMILAGFVALLTVKLAHASGRLERTFPRSPRLADMVAALLPMLFALHIVLVLASLELFDCTEMRGFGFVLDVDPSHFCFDSWWASLLPVALTGVLLFVIALPLGLAIVLRLTERGGSVRDTKQVSWQARYGLVTWMFRDERYWWQLVLMARRIVLAIIATFADSSSLLQGGLAIAALVIVLTAHTVGQPYRSTLVNRLETGALATIVAVIAIGMGVSAGSSQLSEEAEVAWAIVLLVLVLALFAALLGSFCWSVRRRGAAADDEGGEKRERGGEKTDGGIGLRLRRSELRDGVSLPSVNKVTAATLSRPLLQWTRDDVFDFLASKNELAMARSLRDEEVDGEALLEMSERHFFALLSGSNGEEADDSPARAITATRARRLLRYVSEENEKY